MKKMFMSYSNTIERRYRRFKIISISLIVILLGALAFFIYANLDYLVFKTLIADNYIYTETLDKLYGDYLGDDSPKSYSKNFDDIVISIVSERIRSVDGDRYTYLYTPTQYTAQKESTKAVAQEAELIEKTPDTVYLRIPNVSTYTKDFIYDNKEKINKYKNIIIDLQSNHGGELNALYDISELFLEKNAIIGYEKARHPFFSKKIKSKGNKYFDFDNILLLQDAETASAAEGFIVSLKENLDNVTIIGTQSFGKGIGQITIPIKQGFAVKATVLLIGTPQDNSINKVGITPDIEYTDENIIDFTLKQIKQ